ncbi:MAG: hypothetical protein ACRDQZ_04180, partial [Mycobacteriales bacterium]
MTTFAVPNDALGHSTLPPQDLAPAGVSPAEHRSNTAATFPAVRPRRLRQSEPMRRLVAQTRLHPAELVLPLFVKEGLAQPRDIPSLPGVQQHSRDSLRAIAAEAAAAGIGGVMLFGVPEHRDAVGSAGTDPD